MSQRKRIRGSPSTAPEASQQPDANDSEDDNLLSQAQTATQVQRSLEKLTPEQIDQKVSEVVQFILIKDQKKFPIKRADIAKNVVKEYKNIYPEILSRTSRILKQVFGLKLVEIDVKNHVYIVINRLEHLEGDCMKVEGSTAKMGLLMVILSLIFMKGNSAKESMIWEVLKKLRIDPSERHQDLGDVKKLITDEFVRQKYLEYNRVPHTDPPEYEFLWGPRAFHETSKTKVLNFVATIQNKDPKSWTAQYKEAQAEEAAKTAGTPNRPK